jgi:hypothetical protein
LAGYTVLLAQFVGKTVLSQLNVLGTIVENHLIILAKIYFWPPYSIPLIYMAVFILIPQHFDYYSFVESFEIWKSEPSNFVFLLQGFM